MSDKIIIAIDAMGGEKSPRKTIHGLSIFIEKNKKRKDYFFNLFGDEKLINEELKRFTNSFRFKHNIICRKYWSNVCNFENAS